MHAANRRRSLRTEALAAACALLAQGCSLAFVRPLTSQTTTEAPGCTDSIAAPVADAFVAAVAASFGAAMLQTALSGHDEGNAAQALATWSGLVLVPTAASAIYGFHQTNRCRAATSSWCALHDCGEPKAIDDGAQGTGR